MWTEKELYDELSKVNHSREKRLYYANFLGAHPELVEPLLAILFRVDDKTSCRAAWVMEFACGQELGIILPHLDLFFQHIHRVHLDPAVRPVAKICEYLMIAYYCNESNDLRKKLTTAHKETMVEVCFDWMINDEKVATKAYAMTILHLLGKEYDWIHPELTIILERDFHTQSAAFRARARHILKKLRY